MEEAVKLVERESCRQGTETMYRDSTTRKTTTIGIAIVGKDNCHVRGRFT